MVVVCAIAKTLQAILRDFKIIADSDISAAKLKAAAQKTRNALLEAAVKLTKQHNATVKAQRKEEALMAS